MKDVPGPWRRPARHGCWCKDQGSEQARPCLFPTNLAQTLRTRKRAPHTRREQHMGSVQPGDGRLGERPGCGDHIFVTGYAGTEHGRATADL